MYLGEFCLGVSRRLYATELLLLQSCLRRRRLEPPQILIDALVLAEDRRFYYHKGIDWRGVGRAVMRSIQGHVEGASTIEQQLVRTVVSDYRRTLQRKFKEVLLARSLCILANKDEIASCYLAVAYFGWKMQGYRQVCRRLGFNLTLNIDSAAEIVARLKYPQPNSVNLARLEKIATRKRWIVGIWSKYNA